MRFKDENKIPLDLTGSTFAGKVRKLYDSPTAVATFTFVILDQVTNRGQVQMSLTPSETTASPCDPATIKTPRPITEYIYDVERTKPSTEKDRVLQGQVSVSPEVTY
ncbi:MAG TPA: hypothetical protein DCE71_05450 [Parachlamydiales bacterium]|nr:hypothetical protein [Parachlamydiales bacterium]